MDFIETHFFEFINLLISAGLLKYGYRYFRINNLRERQKETDKIKQEQTINSALRSLLRIEIINLCHRAQEKGYLEIWALENLTDMYIVYKNLKGNGAIKELYNKTVTLPQKGVK